MRATSQKVIFLQNYLRLISFARVISQTAYYFEKVRWYLESLIQMERFWCLDFFLKSKCIEKMANLRRHLWTVQKLILILHPFYVTFLFAAGMKNDKIYRHQNVKNALMYRIVQIRDFNSFSFSRLPQQKLGQLIFYVFF